MKILKPATESKVSSGDPGASEQLARLFEADVLVAHEYERVYRKHLRAPEQELTLAILEEAIADFKRYVNTADPKGQRRFLDAEAWIVEADTEWIFSFENICQAVGIDPAYLRGGLCRWKEVHMKELRRNPRAIFPQAPRRSRDRPAA